MMKALRPGRVLYLHGYTPKQIDYGTGGPPLASHLYTQDDLAHHFADMDIVVNHAYEAVLDEGPGHKGQSALIDFSDKKIGLQMRRLDIEPPQRGEIRALASDLYWARFALPFRLNHINLYILDTDEGWVVIDSGINQAETAAHWDALLSGPLSISPLIKSSSHIITLII